MQRLVILWIFILACLVQTSCNIVKKLQADEVILVKNEVKAPGLPPEQRDELKALIKQKPNTKILGMRTYTWFYIWGSKGRQDRRFKRFLRKVGEPPVVLDSGFVYGTDQQMQQYIFNKGYFYAKVHHHIRFFGRKNRKTAVTYMIEPGTPYRIAGFQYSIQDSAISRLIVADSNKRFVNVGDIYDLDNLVKEKNRITEILRNNGYYYFTRDYVNFDADTAYNAYAAVLAANVRNPGTGQHNRYRLNHIRVELVNEFNSSGSLDSVEYKGIWYIYKGYRIKPDVLSRMVILEPGEYYNQSKVQTSYSRLLDMNLFKYVNVFFEPNKHDSTGQLNCFIRMSVLMVNEIVEEPQFITSDQNQALTNRNYRNYGVANNMIFRNKNTFHRGEIMQVTLRSAFEVQPSTSSTKRSFSTEQTVTASLIQPRLLGLRKRENKPDAVRNRTSINLSYSYETNIDFDRHMSTLGYNYQQVIRNSTFSFSPVEISFIHTNPTPTFQTKLNGLSDIFLKNLFSNNLIINNRFTYIYKNQVTRKGKSYIYFLWDPFEFGGNVLYAIHNLSDKKKDTALDAYRFLDLNYYQYYRTSADFRYNHILDKNNTLVYRAYAGIGLPYGNSKVLPLERRYFMGGANDLRAWRPRILGPGSYVDPANTQIDRSGEIKLEANIEYRFNIFDKYLEGALFTDAGNIWLARKNSSVPKGEFDFSRFSQEVAIDAGIGARFNFTFFIFRLDAALPLRDPGFALNKRWVINDIDTNKWVQRNVQFNLAIGYPF